jgi:hypothetical protein
MKGGQISERDSSKKGRDAEDSGGGDDDDGDDDDVWEESFDAWQWTQDSDDQDQDAAQPSDTPNFPRFPFGRCLNVHVHLHVHSHRSIEHSQERSSMLLRIAWA